MLNRCGTRFRSLGWLRLSPIGNWIVLRRQAGGMPGKRRGKYRGQFEFVDKVRIVANGGKGGNGCISLEGESATRRRPSGGSGGAGGNVYAIADKALETLDSDLHHYNGHPGAPGGASGKKGRAGKDTYIRVPCGTFISKVVKEEAFSCFHPWALADGIECGGRRDTVHQSKESDDIGGEEGWGFDSDEDAGEFDDVDANHDEGKAEDLYQDVERYVGRDDGSEEEVQFLADLEQHGDKVLLASGGKPGLGNLNIASRRVGTKLPGQRGESRYYLFELCTIADVGLVGYPNAGKSTLLGCITAAKPKVAIYPFTTLTPVVGHVEYSDALRLRVADIPGLIDGAHRNRGLGHEFLRHIARTRALMFVVDVAGSEGRDPIQDFASLKEELRLYDEELIRKPAFVVANKIDLPESRIHLERLRETVDPLPVVSISALESRGLLDVAVTMREMLEAGGRGCDSAPLGATPGHVPVHQQTGKGGGGDVGAIAGARGQNSQGGV